MNTADRSIALVDAALRRRFYFVPFLPTEPPVSDVLKQVARAARARRRARRLFRELNKRIATSEIAIGPSYFMTARRPGAQPRACLAARDHAAPRGVLLRHRPDVEREFGLKALREALSGTAEPPSGEQPTSTS